MRIGFVTPWVNRGRGVVTRQIRGIADDAGHETFVLSPQPHEAMPGVRGDAVDWPVDGVTFTPHRAVPDAVYERWAADHELDLVVCDMNLDFGGIERLRARGIGTLGRFVWERFRRADARKARRAYDVIYSLTRVEQARYERLGIDSPYVAWGVHPSTIGRTAVIDGVVRFFVPLGMQGPRKPMRSILRAFASVPGDVELVLKSQAARADGEQATTTDPRVVTLCDDVTDAEYRGLLASCHVMVAPSRWEGLGVHLYEALGLAMPVVANRMAPIDEVVVDGVNGLLCASRPVGRDRSGFRVHEPDAEDLARCLREAADPERIEVLRAGAARVRDGRPWSQTVEDYRSLFDRFR